MSFGEAQNWLKVWAACGKKRFEYLGGPQMLQTKAPQAAYRLCTYALEVG